MLIVRIKFPLKYVSRPLQSGDPAITETVFSFLQELFDSLLAEHRQLIMTNVI